MRITLRDGTVIDQEAATMEIETNLGTLIVEAVNGTGIDYPGVYIGLKRPNGKVFTPFLVEVDRYHAVMKAHYWSTENHFDAPVWDAELSAEEIDSVFEELEKTDNMLDE